MPIEKRPKLRKQYTTPWLTVDAGTILNREEGTDRIWSISSGEMTVSTKYAESNPEWFAFVDFCLTCRCEVDTGQCQYPETTHYGCGFCHGHQPSPGVTYDVIQQEKPGDEAARPMFRFFAHGYLHEIDLKALVVAIDMQKWERGK